MEKRTENDELKQKIELLERQLRDKVSNLLARRRFLCCRIDRNVNAKADLDTREFLKPPLINAAKL